MKDHTPQKEDLANRRSRDSPLKKPQKIPKKRLNAVFPLVSEEISPETVKDLSDFYSISELSDADYSSQISPSSVLALSPALSAATETFPLSDVASASKIPTTSDEPDNVSVERCGFHKPDGSLEFDIVAEYLKQARTQVLKSANVDQQSKKLLDALVKVVLDECYALPEERDWYSEILSVKGRIAFLCFLLWSFMVSVIFFFVMGLDNGYIGPLPT
ncbi:hypothetical protein JCGZ_19019 [Jatropha curcas]|uniref:Uncharacterized protein n=1 Tax=Jatropha curcas TaxID=180498 RepID=A0A067K7Z1_JATCU|nr:protein SINE3 [Jatropha curcas]XP_020538696.1 protein SINE3 [Jatropha curcas]XP_020538697.1 protein SINE3 [Jatropha curcas]XP_037492046.1 protein SINE3 [Jatropha curcas]KDP27939.1 hypothetical protein JCGZ_19019 [Jatropha curcas]